MQAYRTDLEDDNDEFSYMQEDDFTSLPLGNDEADMDEDEDEDDDEPRESVSAAALREELRDAIRHKVRSLSYICRHVLNIFAGYQGYPHDRS